MEVVMLIREAWANKEIADHLKISDQTVRRHLGNIFDKVGCFSRTELAVKAMSPEWMRRHFEGERQDLLKRLSLIEAMMEAKV